METVMSKEEFYEKINNGMRVFEGYTFKHFAIENVTCESLTFIDCKFFDMKLIHNEVDQIKFERCRLVKSEICGTLTDANIELSNVDFIYCWIHDLEISSKQKDMEWKCCFYKRCTLENIKLCLDISFGGYLMKCKGKQLELIFRQMARGSFYGGKFESVKIGADATNNSFSNVEIQGLEKMDTGRKLDWSANTFRNCMINGEEKDISLLKVQIERNKRMNEEEK